MTINDVDNLIQLFDRCRAAHIQLSEIIDRTDLADEFKERAAKETADLSLEVEIAIRLLSQYKLEMMLDFKKRGII